MEGIAYQNKNGKKEKRNPATRHHPKCKKLSTTVRIIGWKFLDLTSSLQGSSDIEEHRRGER
jgi:hypothetical protein